MAYYVPQSEKVGGHVPPVPHQIAPMISLMIENISFNAFYKRCGLQRDLKSFSSCSTLLLHISGLCKSYKSFQCYCASCLQPLPYQNLH